MKLINLQDLSNFLGIKTSKARNMVHRGELPVYRIGRLLRFNLDEIMEILQKNKEIKTNPAPVGLQLRDLDLSVRAENCLHNAEITTVNQLLTKTDNMLLAVKNFGKQTLKEIDIALENFDLIRKKF